MKKTIVIALSAAIAIPALALVFASVGFLLAEPLKDVFGAPKVTVINMTGEPIRGISIGLGPLETNVDPLEHTQARTVGIRGDFPESSTLIRWTDSVGTHNSRADDYMENYGFYHTTIVLSGDRKAIAVRILD